ncbi:MAG: SPOR domain-containing protein, partial [Planktothrix sp.]
TIQPGGGQAATVATAKATTPTQTQTRPMEPIKSGDGYYYVVLDYKGERSFEQAKEVITDAYIAEFKTGKKIQLGALTDAAGAKRLRDELQVQGIPAYYDVVKP